jgi:hypothetical protein
VISGKGGGNVPTTDPEGMVEAVIFAPDITGATVKVVALTIVEFAMIRIP